ncbi:LysE family translocator [Pelagibacteraceae bacterium]|jgi:homoserine/homoserine lactone efflux protein|nr:LysE family translocator [Pelagibacteraceae bacterium]
MLPENYLLFLQIIIVMFVTPGGPRVLIMSQSINYGFGKSLWTAFGDVTANCIQMLLVLFGLGALLKIFPDIVIVFKWVGVSYLLYVAYGFYKSKANIDINTGKQVKSNILLFRDGFFIAFFSPKAVIFFAAVFPTFLTGENYMTHFIVMLISYVVLDFLTLAIYSKVAEKIIDQLKSNPKTLNYVSAAALIVIATFIAIKV